MVRAMSDIFISYASADRPRAQRMAQALEGEGWTVWWDRKVPPGKAFNEVISEALDAARCVIVLWSKSSVRSDWVKEEAAEAARRKTLVPALIDDVQIPLGFRRIQAARLIGWEGADDDPEFQQLLASVARILGVARPTSAEKGDVAAQKVFMNEKSATLPQIGGLKKHSWRLRWPAASVTFLVFPYAGFLAGDLTHRAYHSNF
jgi:hypothetical protein